MKTEEIIREIIMDILFLDHAEDERELRCYDDITEERIQKCILEIEREFGVFLDGDSQDFVTVKDLIDAVKLELSGNATYAEDERT